MPSEREAILEAALARAGAEGWTWSCIERAAEDLGLERAAARRRFPRGLRDALEALNDMFDARAEAAIDRDGLAGMAVRDRIAALVQARLAVMAPYRGPVRRLAARGATPAGAPEAMRSLAHTVDRMWRLAGDRTTGFDYYTKRGLLAGVYGATLLCWLDDDSTDFAATRAFLDRRIAGVMRIGKARGRLERTCAAFDAPLKRVLRAAGDRHARAAGS